VIRAVAVISLVAVLVLALYLPSAFAPVHFLAQLRTEYHAVAEFWSPAVASRMLEVALNLLDTTLQDTPMAPFGAPAAGGAIDTAVSREMATVSQRLFDNPYFRSIEALMLLALFRLRTIGHAMPWLLPFIAAAFCDGQVMRLRKAREFGRHDPELFALAVVASIVAACATFVALLAPANVPVWVWPVVPLVIGWLLSRALACFHLRG